MIEQSAVVVEIDDSHVVVDCDTRRACERCARGEGCGGGILQALLGERQHRVLALRDGRDVSVDQRVRIGLGEHVVLRAAALVYLPPLLGLFLGGGLIAALVPGAEAWVAVGGLLGLASGIAVARLGARRLAGAGLQPVLLGPCEDAA